MRDWIEQLNELADAHYDAASCEREVLEEMIAFLAETRQGTRFLEWLKRRLRGKQASTRTLRMQPRVRGSR